MARLAETAVRQRARAASRAASSAHGRGWHGRQTAEVAAVGCVAEVGRGAGGRAEEAALEADEEVDEAWEGRVYVCHVEGACVCVPW